MKLPAFFKALLAVFFTLGFGVVSLPAQGTAFTYQGRLLNNGSPANGSYDLSFALYVTNVTGAVVAGPVTNPAVVVTNGLFTTVVNLGGGIFTGSNYWLQLAVSTNSANLFAALLPRQQITPTPYAIFANTASNLSGTLSAAQLSGLLPASQLGGTLAAAQLPATVLTNNEGGVSLNGSFNGNGAGVTNIQLSGVGPAGTFTVLPLYFNPRPIVMPYTTLWMVYADVNGDGKPDLIIQSPISSVAPFPGGFYVLTNAGNGIFVPASTNLDGNSSVGAVYPPAVADFNNDGKMDLALLDNFGVVVYKGNGDGSFVSVWTNELSAPPAAIAAADINGDGSPDIVYATGNPVSTLTSLINFGGGGFTFSVGQTLNANQINPSAASRLLLTDLNGDGSPDLVYFGTAGLVTLTNRNGLFKPVATNSAGISANAWVAGDVYGNGRQDIITANQNYADVIVFSNAGGGIMVSNSAFGVGNVPVSVVIITNSSGLVTYLATANGQDQTVTYLANDGRGNFLPFGTVSLGSPADSQYDLVAADLNGDGNPDLIMAGNNTIVEAFSYQQVVTVTNAISLTSPGNTINGNFTGDGSALGNLNASSVVSGTLPDARLSANVPCSTPIKSSPGTTILTT